MSIFNKIQKVKLPFSTHNLSHSSLMSLNVGQIYVANFEELVPNSKISYANGFRLMSDALFAPAFQDIKFVMRDFIVPHRLVFDKFPEFISCQPDSADAPLMPYEPYTTIKELVNHATGNLTTSFVADMFRIPPVDKTLLASSTTNIGDKKVRLLPILSFLKIYADWFADENFDYNYNEFIKNVQNVATFPYISNTDTAALPDSKGNVTTRNILELLFNSLIYSANLPKNYFTAALPFQQKGASVRIPGLSGQKNVKFVGDNNFSNASNRLQVLQGVSQSNESDQFGVVSPYNGTSVTSAGHLVVDFDEESTEIVQLRNRLAMQQFLERNATGGTRFVEFLRSHYGSTLPDPFCQRSVYLRGSSYNIGADPVYSNALTLDAGDPANFVGDVSGKINVSAGSTNVGFRAKEHCFHFTLVYVLMPPAIGVQGLPKIITRNDPFEYPLPEFSNVGEQVLQSDELIFSPFSKPDSVAGYVPRYADFKFHANEIHGEFRNLYSFWHATKFHDYTDSAQMNYVKDYQVRQNTFSGAINSFLEGDKMFAVTDKLVAPFKLWFYTNYRHGLPVTKYGTPKNPVIR